jgi:hypothetical protein
VDVTGETSAAGEHKANAVLSGNSVDNYKLPKNSSVKFRNQAKGEIRYDSEGYEGVVNSKYHGITVKVRTPKEAKVTYGTSKKKCTLSKSPTYKKAGSYTVYYKIEAKNYETVTGKEIVRILERAKSAAPDVLTDLSGARFSKLKPRSDKQTQNSITLSWNKAKGAEMYVIYGNQCDSKGHAHYLKKLGEVKGKKSSFKVKHIDATKLNKGTMHKFCIVAYDEDGKILEKSATIHVTTTGSKWKNYDKVKLTAPKESKVTLKKKKTFTITAKAEGKKVRKHVDLRYESTNKRIATVSKKRVIKPVGKGTCKVNVYAQNGKYKAIEVTVK